MERKQIALVAHDNKKDDLLAWIKTNREELKQHDLFATGTTGKLIEETLNLPVTRFKSGPLGGDQQIGAKIAGGKIDFLIFFWDPLESLSHDTDIKALLRIAVVWNVPLACNQATADYVISSRLMKDGYERNIPNYDDYLNREV